MRSTKIALAPSLRLPAALAATLFGVLLSGCSENNEGNVRTPPPPQTLTSSGSGSVIPVGGSSTTGGTGNTGGAGSGDSKDLDKPWPSSGCGKPLPANQVPTVPGSRTGYTEYTVMETGATLDSLRGAYAQLENSTFEIAEAMYAT